MPRMRRTCFHLAPEVHRFGVAVPARADLGHPRQRRGMFGSHRERFPGVGIGQVGLPRAKRQPGALGEHAGTLACVGPRRQAVCRFEELGRTVDISKELPESGRKHQARAGRRP